MRLLWWRAGARVEGTQQQAWLAAWRDAVGSLDEAALRTLEVQTERRRQAGDDVEIEEERLDAARRAIALNREIVATGLPTLATSHRVVGTDACHSAPASFVDEPAQPSGRLLLTSSRAIFLGGPKLIQVPWHSIRDVRDHDRDVLLIRGHDEGLRFRCNTYGDALAGAAIARYLVPRARRI